MNKKKKKISKLQNSIDNLNNTIEYTQNVLDEIIKTTEQIKIKNSLVKGVDGSVNGSGQKMAVKWILDSAKIVKNNCDSIQQSDINLQIVNLKNDVNNVKKEYDNAKGKLHLNELDLLVKALVDTAELQVKTLLFYNKFVNRLCTVTP